MNTEECAPYCIASIMLRSQVGGKESVSLWMKIGMYPDELLKR